MDLLNQDTLQQCTSSICTKDLSAPPGDPHGALSFTTKGWLHFVRDHQASRQHSDVNRPTVWNSLPAALRAPDRSLTGFKHHPKTYLFEH